MGFEKGCPRLRVAELSNGDGRKAGKSFRPDLLPGRVMAKSHGLPKSSRIRSRVEIDTVFRKGRYHSLGILHAKVLPITGGKTRFLISVKKAIGSAPQRNRIKRLVREAMRLNLSELGTPHDICFFLTAKPIHPVAYSIIEEEILRLFGHLSKSK